MKLLVIDGNSIINRAFYGIKLLSTKDGRFTNGIYGFLSILIKLREECQPDAIAVAFDLKEPTFRHKMYSEYKAGRKGMPPELAQQMPVLKELLLLLGIKTIEKPGYEADDILGTLSDACTKQNWDCFIATGDRDSLQLIGDKVTVLLASTKMGKAVTVHCDPAYVLEKYSVTPKQLIDIKALMGDSSDNIPGVAGIGEKTACALISSYESIDYIYEHLDELDIKQGVHDKLAADRDNAFLSRILGTICLTAPIDTTLDTYIVGSGDGDAASRLLASLEMFGMIDKLGLKNKATHSAVESSVPADVTPIENCNSFAPIYESLKGAKKAVFICRTDGASILSACFTDGKKLMALQKGSDFAGFDTFLSDASIKKYVDDSKHLYSYAISKGIELNSVVFDAALAGYILNPSANAYDPLRLLSEYGVGKLRGTSADTEDEEILETEALGIVSEYIISLIDANNQADLLVLEISLAEVLAAMELDGFMVDAEGLKAYGETIAKKVDEISKKIYDEAGFEFNLNSPKQLGTALFETLGIPAKKKTKSGYSTNAEVLESLAPDYPIVADILSYRTVAKLKSTYCDGLYKVIDKDGRIHSTLNQTETRTGRISSTEPNLQNIPVRKPLGSELRKFFVAKPGYLLIDADYSQIELRVLAHMANDANMINAFKSGEDIHRITAAQVFGLEPAAVTPLMRSRAKAVNFGIVYGIGAFSLAKDIGVTRAEADAYIKGYLLNFSGVRDYMQDVVETAKNTGYVKTLYERRRYLPELTSSNGMLRSFGERVARNMPVQGTAADIIKIAMVKVYNRLKAENLDAKLILQVHDELIVEAKEEIAEKVKVIVKEEMENACSLSVSLLADANVGKTWYDAKG